jgi:amidase
MPYFFQEIFELADLFSTDPNATQPVFGISYNQALAIDHDAGVNGIDAALAQFNLDAVVAPTDSPAWTTDLILADHFLFASSGLAGGPGYPIVQVPAALVNGMPMGISFLGTAFSEPTLIKLASGFEAATHARAPPTFSGDITSAHTAGTTLRRPRGVRPNKNVRPHRM